MAQQNLNTSWSKRFSDQLHLKIRSLISYLQKYADRFWYPPVVGILAALDNFVIVIPNDGILISSSMLVPRRWLSLALWVAIGSTVGALLLATVVEWHGMPWILKYFPGINESKAWLWTFHFFDRYGLLVVFFVAVTPLVQQPAVILAALAETPLLEIAAVVFVGRFIKFAIMAYIGSHAPRLLSKLWGVRGELEEVGIHTEFKK